MKASPAATVDRLEREQISWLATVRPTGWPHLVPLWFVWADGSIYLCVAGASVKVRNLVANPTVALALESGSAPIVVEGHATLLARPWPDEVVLGFQRKYNPSQTNLRGVFTAGLSEGLGDIPHPRITNPHARFFFTEAGWKRYGCHGYAAARRRGHHIRLIRRKNPAPSQVVYRDPF